MMSLLYFLFFLHDVASAFLAKHFIVIKRGLLLVAHLSLLGFFFPGMRQDFGSLALAALLGLLFLSPVSKIFRMRLLLQLMGLRREMGIIMGYLATVHVMGYLIDPDWFEYLIAPYWPGNVFSMETRYLFGLGAYMLTLPLLLTSNTWANRILGGKNWKRLHVLVYPLLVLVLFHKFLQPGTVSVEDVFLPLFILSIYGLVKALAYKNFISLFVKLLSWGAAQYKEYVAMQKQKDNTEEIGTIV